MLTDKEIIDAVVGAPAGWTSSTTLLAVGRAVEAKVLAKHAGLHAAVHEVLRNQEQFGMQRDPSYRLLAGAVGRDWDRPGYDVRTPRADAVHYDAVHYNADGSVRERYEGPIPGTAGVALPAKGHDDGR
jgi:hypothetical protein